MRSLRNDVVHMPMSRRLFAAALAACAAPLRARAVLRRPNRSHQHTAVLIEPFGMGDVLSLDPLVKALHDRGRKIVICAREEWKPLLPSDLVDTWVAASFPWSQYRTRKKYAPGALFGRALRACVTELRHHAAGGTGIDPRGDVRSCLVLHLAGCRHVYSLSHYLGSDLSVPSWAARVVTPPFDKPRWQVNLALLDAAAAAADVGATGRPSVRHLASGRDPDPRLVAFIPVAPWPGKTWAQEKWNGLATRLRKDGYSLLVLCGPGQRGVAESVLDGEHVVRQCDNVQDWVHELEAVAGVVALNTGPMHVADALDRPLVLLNGSSPLPLWGPSGPFSVVVDGQAGVRCAPCREMGRVACSLECFQNIAVEDVDRQLRVVLQRAHTRS